MVACLVYRPGCSTEGNTKALQLRTTFLDILKADLLTTSQTLRHCGQPFGFESYEHIETSEIVSTADRSTIGIASSKSFWGGMLIVSCPPFFFVNGTETFL